MKKIIILLVVVFCCSLGNANAQQNTLKTSVRGDSGRYEILEINITYCLLLDKHEGRVWVGKSDKLMASPVLVEGHEEQLSKIDTTKINYRVYVLEGGFESLLINIHSGETWRFNLQDTPKHWGFKKMITP